MRSFDGVFFRHIDKASTEELKKDFVTSVNNPLIINPTFYLNIEEIEMDGKIVLYINVPESSQVHHCKGKIYDRNEDGDFNITNNTNLVSELYVRKQTKYTENKIFPYADMNELEDDLFARVRKIVKNMRADHPWYSMDNIDLLKSAGMYLKDQITGKQGITLAGILIFGSELMIQTALPHYRTDAILRRENLDRYDDRDDIRVNLLRSYERLMQFVSKHLNDKFYLEGTQRVSLRDKIFREAITNLLIHREFSNPFPAKFIIENKRVFIENANKPHGIGIIDPDDFSPYPKNPKIAKFFKEIGWVDELGSGVRNIYKYNKIYSGAAPEFIEGNIFQTIIPLAKKTSAHDGAHDGEHDSAHDGDQDKTTKLLEFCKEPKSRIQIQEFLDIKSRSYLNQKIMKPLIKEGFLKLTIPDKPTSKNQKYYSKKQIIE